MLEHIKKINSLEYKIETDAVTGMNVPVRVFANDDLLKKMINDRTIEQAVNVAMLPGVQKNVVVLPDGHQGYGFPVGGVAAMDYYEGIISPGSVGYDINCGVRLVRTNLTEAQVRPRLEALVAELFATIPAGMSKKEGCIDLSSSELDEVLVRGVPWLADHNYATKDDIRMCEEGGHMEGADPHAVSDVARRRAMPQLGSIGSGNHFLEIQKVDKIHDLEAAKLMGLEEGLVTILIHCGSRGFGHQICKDYLVVCEHSHQKYGIELPDRQLACVPNLSEEGESYKKAMRAAMNYSWCNRQAITHWTRRSFELVFGQSESDLDMKLIYDIAHNSAKVETHRIDGCERKVTVHRKGATRAFPAGSAEIPEKYRKIGQPTFIPGSMGSASWVLLGMSSSLELTFGSTVHGAGRLMSRTAAHKAYNYKQVVEDLQRKGIHLRSTTRYDVVEEAPQVYKDVDIVAEISHRLGIATKVARLVPIGVMKG
ncbi:MAG: RtcB family protein [Candidatus Nitrosotenuis sp.]|uniref:tRNA-splicing ligase RtcB n=1 Tax=Candidatus Nitrosotenuis uzonensis TaxID=1407055 RepID=A0A812EUJ3_9ARCH|nr:RtcB family protein [Candidatus Nitrosotenuis uzonensis]CAE6487410.1 tRNA-splicing ligase RtcB [Candidatus Nitrosotenuis uzonensis]